MKWKWIGLYLAVYAAALTWLAVFEKYEIVEALFVLAFAGAFTLIAYFATKGRAEASPPALGGSSALLIAYFIALALVVTYFPSNEALKIATKLVAFVVVPLLLFRMRLTLRFPKRDVIAFVILAIALTLFQLVFGNGPRKIAAAGLHGWALALAATASFVWMSIEAGLVEEVPFRALLQTRLEQWTGSAAGGIVIASLAFALIHAPGLYLRTGATGESFTHATLGFAIGYAIAVLSPIALFLGYLWMRTRNIVLLVLVHGVIDTVPHIVEVAQFVRLS